MLLDGHRGLFDPAISCALAEVGSEKRSAVVSPFLSAPTDRNCNTEFSKTNGSSAQAFASLHTLTWRRNRGIEFRSL
tara:strand:+ start:175134 stop:175364 length:231 start_codon:yes stop_codon:yes gene_type:complete